jgi:hypothetical protein
MRWRFLQIFAGALFATAVVGTGQTARAGLTVIDPTTYGTCIGLGTCSLGVWTLLAEGGVPVCPSCTPPPTFDEQNLAGQKGLGIDYFHTGQLTDPEIQAAHEAVFMYSSVIDTTITKIQLAQLYQSIDGEIIKLYGDNSLSGTLQILADGSFAVGGDLNGAGVSLLDPTKGLWQLLYPFGNNPSDQLAFSTPSIQANTFYDFSYSIASIDSVSVPEPANLPLFATSLGLMALLAWRRNRLVA